MKSALLFGAVLAVVLFLPESRAAALDVAAILHRSVEANLRNYEALPRFNYFKAGRGPDGTSRTYDLGRCVVRHDLHCNAFAIRSARLWPMDRPQTGSKVKTA